MEKVAHISRSFEESDRADRAYYRALSPQRRLEILYELNSRWPVNGDHAASGSLERVCRIVKLS